MTITTICIGKTDSSQLEQLIDKYLKRLNFYIKHEFVVIPDPKNRKSLSIEQQKTEEGKQIINQTNTSDFVVLLDEKGKLLSSKEFSVFLSKKMVSGLKRLVFVIGGPYGFSDDVYQRANQKLSLSKMTFSHQMVRLFFTEQLYRGFTILKNEPYHHE